MLLGVTQTSKQTNKSLGQLPGLGCPSRSCPLGPTGLSFSPTMCATCPLPGWGLSRSRL